LFRISDSGVIATASTTQEDEMQAKFANQSNSATRSVCAGRGYRDEARLIADAKAGSLDAFDQLVRRYEVRVCRLAQTIAHNREDADEITQNAFLQAFKNLSYFRGDSRFYTWLTRITINAGLMQLRRRRFNEISIDDSVETEEGNFLRELEDARPTPEQHYSRSELHGILASTINKLDTEYRTVFHLRDVWGFSTQETAHALDLSLSAVKTRLRRARLQLRRSLGTRFNPKCFNTANGRRTVSIGTVLLALVCMLSTRPLLAQQPANATAPPSSDLDFSSRQYLFGNWGGERDRLAEHGVTFDFFYIADLLANPSGGERQRDTGWGRIRGTVDVDLGKLIGA
jgi:RNA polymerase sigma-70 factor, ECF subfamily